MNRYHSLQSYFRRKFTYRVQKLPLDAGLTCPNRDGTIALKGCTFCDALGSGTGLAKNIPSLHEQGIHWQRHYNRKKVKYIGYLQSFSNTHCTSEYLRKILNDCTTIPDMIGIAIGTRADCLNEEKLHIIAQNPLPEKWLEIGIQSVHNTTLTRINRGHSFDIVPPILERAYTMGLLICVHIMAGLPGESPEDFLKTLNTTLQLPIHALKIHNVCVLCNTQLAKEYQKGLYTPLSQTLYFQLLAEVIASTPSHIILQRINADPPKNTLIAPLWANDKELFLHGFPAFLEDNGIWQGVHCNEPERLPLWFTSFEELPHILHDEAALSLDTLYKQHPHLAPFPYAF